MLAFHLPFGEACGFGCTHSGYYLHVEMVGICSKGGERPLMQLVPVSSERGHSLHGVLVSAAVFLQGAVWHVARNKGCCNFLTRHACKMLENSLFLS